MNIYIYINNVYVYVCMYIYLYVNVKECNLAHNLSLRLSAEPDFMYLLYILCKTILAKRIKPTNPHFQIVGIPQRNV